MTSGTNNKKPNMGTRFNAEALELLAQPEASIYGHYWGVDIARLNEL